MAEKTPVEAIQEALKAAPERKFTETVEVAINLKELDLTLPKNRVEEEVILPKGRGKTIKVGVFGSNEMAQKVRSVADLVITPDQMDELFKTKRISRKQVNAIDFFLAEAPMMPLIGKKLGPVMGPRGKVPRPIPPGSDPTSIIKNLKQGIRVRNKGKRTFHAPLGIRSMPPEQLAENLQLVLNRVVGKLERGRHNIASVYVKTSMGPAVRLW
ncbi:MAG: 50S ribosomal protein L1 [Euryarchaeota archaeon]|nr:50S ribosomal protein L1 [Euryarchaeota archaeon]MDE1835945.1 50S ribosomal protein L1 [Euryarchaeota archaeon]MDE1880617.1 50S ribosomal protein L1 [Euryarchaeota archaeon]MDE2044377.1 50S ribosomal protein L1 [Thermoplasmata archaeon]